MRVPSASRRELSKIRSKDAGEPTRGGLDCSAMRVLNDHVREAELGEEEDTEMV